jgi:acetyl esterase
MLRGILGLAVIWMCSAPVLTAAEPEQPAAPNAKPTGARQPDERHVFKTTPQGDLKLHVYLPSGWKAEEKRPAIVFWFGGGFTKGSPIAFSRQSEYFASRGLVCICAEYRIKSVHGTAIDKCLEDARSAMRWVKSHASQLGIDPEKVIVSGGSAGGTLALSVALADGPNAKEDDLAVSLKPCAMVLFNPAQGIAGMAKQGETSAAADDDKARIAGQISQIDHPQKDEPPAIFFFGTDDRLLKASREFCLEAAKTGNRAELWTAEGQGHSFFNRPPWYQATLRKADEFLVSLGYLQGSPVVAADPSAILKRELLQPEATVQPTGKP